MPDPQAWTDERADQIIGKLLRAGVALSAAVVFIGGVLYLIRHGADPPDYSSFRGEPEDLRAFTGILRGVAGLDPRHIIQFGLGLLVATPVARVAFSVFAFTRERDRTYVVVTLIVLAILLASIAGLI